MAACSANQVLSLSRRLRRIGVFPADSDSIESSTPELTISPLNRLAGKRAGWLCDSRPSGFTLLHDFEIKRVGQPPGHEQPRPGRGDTEAPSIEVELLRLVSQSDHVAKKPREYILISASCEPTRHVDGVLKGILWSVEIVEGGD